MPALPARSHRRRTLWPFGLGRRLVCLAALLLALGLLAPAGARGEGPQPPPARHGHHAPAAVGDDEDPTTHDDGESADPAATAPARDTSALTPARLLQPNEVAVVANFSDGYSAELARYYMQRRGIPQRQLLVTGMPTKESISRRDYETLIAEPLRDFLVDEKLDHVRAVVLMYGVPLRVLEPEPSPDSQQMERQIRDARQDSLQRVLALITRVQELAGVPPKLPDYDPKASVRKQLGALGGGMVEAMQAANMHTAALSEAEAQAVRTRLADVQRKAFGTRPPEQHAEAEDALAWSARSPGEQRLLALANQPPTPKVLADLLAALRGERGDFGVLAAADTLLARVKPDWTSRAAVDSELATLFWPAFPLARWVRNPLNARMRGAAANAPRTLMVCRLDGPGPKVVRRMIDDALATEATGLAGNVYIDGRGLRGSDAYARYDEDLVLFSEIMEEQTTFSTTLDEHGALFPAGSCPDAALYVGWYSLAKYVPAFTFRRGAVAYHIASNEAVTLRSPTAANWCPSLLRAGACATLGPVAEPYLTAFPYASDFYGMLLTGRVTLVEAYYKSLPHLSWMMTLVGDPLYAPFKAHPALDAADFIDYISE